MISSNAKCKCSRCAENKLVWFFQSEKENGRLKQNSYVPARLLLMTAAEQESNL